MSNIIEITDFSAPQFNVYARLKEPQLLHYEEPKEGLFIAESPKVVKRALDAGYKPVSFLLAPDQLKEETLSLFARFPDVPVYTADTGLLIRITGFKLTRGVLSAMRRRPLPTPEEVCRDARRIAVLENVVNPTNVGAIFRSAAALGMDAVLLTGGCSDPLYRRAVRVSMGTVFQIPWSYLSSLHNSDPRDYGLHNFNSYNCSLHNMGFQTAALALSEDSIPINDPRLPSVDKLALILGTEGDGLAPSTIASCDYTVKIPMARSVDSLNVAAASAVAFWEIQKHFL